MENQIWYRRPELAFLNDLSPGTLAEGLGMVFTKVGEDYLCAKMPVDARTHQVLKLLHGGASVALSETLGSTAAQMTVDPRRFFVVGQSIFSHHLRPVTGGFVYATAKPIHIGRKTQVWDIDVVDEAQKRVHTSRLTVAVLENKGVNVPFPI